MKWYAAKNKETNEVQFTLSKEGLDPSLHEFVELSREPTEFDDFLDDKLIHNSDRERKIKDKKELIETTVEELTTKISKNVFTKLAETGIITPAQAKKLLEEK